MLNTYWPLKLIKLAAAIVPLALLLHGTPANGQSGAPIVTATSIVRAAERLVSWQQGTIGDVATFLPPDKLDTFVFRRTVNPRGWVHAAFLIGLKDWAEATDNNRHWDWLKDFATKQQFKPADRVYHADDQAVAQYYIALSEQYSSPKMLAPTQERFDTVVDNPSSVDLDHSVKATKANRDRDYQRECQFRWCWCDALFMAPPGYFQLSQATGDDSYARFADKEFWATTDYLFRDLPGTAKGSGLFLRDSTFFKEKLDENGDQIFWSRGNGWVFAGIPAILEALPAGSPLRGRYVTLFKQMAKAIKATQVTSGKYSGFWGPSLLAFDLYPFPESSGTGFFVGALCWGVLNGHLDAKEYVAPAVAGWQALVSVQQADGRIGWVQQIGSAPDEVKEDVTQMYGSGAFLQAAAGMLGLHDKGLLILDSLRGFTP